MDVTAKIMVLAVGVYNTVLWRSLLAAAIAAAGWAAGSRERPVAGVLKLHTLRAVISGLIFLSFFWGLARLPLAEAIGLSFVAPLFALSLAALLLGERIGRQAIWASIVGIAGVAVVVAGQLGQPNYSANTLLGTLAVLLSTALYGYNLVLGRRQALLAKPVEIVFFQNLAIAAILGLVAPWLAIALPRNLWLPAAGVTLLSLGAQFLLSWSYARAQAQHLVPTEYSAMVWAIAFGWFFFDESVSWTTLTGAGMIVVSCLIAAGRFRLE